MVEAEDGHGQLQDLPDSCPGGSRLVVKRTFIEVVEPESGLDQQLGGSAPGLRQRACSDPTLYERSKQDQEGREGHGATQQEDGAPDEDPEFELHGLSDAETNPEEDGPPNLPLPCYRHVLEQGDDNGGSGERVGAGAGDTASSAAQAASPAEATAIADVTAAIAAAGVAISSMAAAGVPAEPLALGAVMSRTAAQAAAPPTAQEPLRAPGPVAEDTSVLELDRLVTENNRLALENRLLRENMRLAMENRLLAARCSAPEAPEAPEAQGPRRGRRERRAAARAAEEDSAARGEGARPAIACDVPAEQRTTVMLRNLPNNYSRAMVLAMLDGEGFSGLYDFLYLPIDFKSRACLGYAFVNLVGPEVVPLFWERFAGYSRWVLPSRKICGVSWSGPHQGLSAHVERYRNSPVMHSTVPEEFKPVMFVDGTRVVFPLPLKAPRAPRVRNLTESRGQFPPRHRT